MNESLYNDVDRETTWNVVHHRTGEVPRLLCIQGTSCNDGRVIPVYRHPMDDEPKLIPFTPTTIKIKENIEKLLKLTDKQKFNHVLVQKYRSGADFIGEHADKTLDIGHDTFIVNYSMGSERVLTLRSKEKKSDGTFEIQYHPLPNDSIFVMDLSLNKKMKHSIHRQFHETGTRISLTFRRIETFYDKVEKRLLGQGAPKEDKCRDIIDATVIETEKTNLLKAFKEENCSAQFDWHEWYGKGFSVSFIDYEN